MHYYSVVDVASVIVPGRHGLEGGVIVTGCRPLQCVVYIACYAYSTELEYCSLFSLVGSSASITVLHYKDGR